MTIWGLGFWNLDPQGDQCGPFQPLMPRLKWWRHISCQYHAVRTYIHTYIYMCVCTQYVLITCVYIYVMYMYMFFLTNKENSSNLGGWKQIDHIATPPAWPQGASTSRPPRKKNNIVLRKRPTNDTANCKWAVRILSQLSYGCCSYYRMDTGSFLWHSSVCADFNAH